MEDKTVSLCFLLLFIGIVITCCSLMPYPIRKTEAYAIPYSRICYDHYQFSIASSSSKCITVEGPGVMQTIPENATLKISFQAHPNDVNFHIERRSVVITYKRFITPHLSTRMRGSEEIQFIPHAEIKGNWETGESYPDASFLSVDHTVSRGSWLYSLRFENVDLTNKTIDLSVTEYWSEYELGEVVSGCYLLPFCFAYIGASTLAIGVIVSAWGTATKKFTGADVRNFLLEVYHDLSYYMENKKIIIAVMLTLVLTFLSIFAHARLGSGEIFVGEETKKAFFTYFGFPSEMIGTMTPLSPEDVNLVSHFYDVYVFSHGSTKMDFVVSYTTIAEGTLAILWDGVVLNFIIYFALSFALVLVLSYLSEKLHSETFIEKIGRRLPDF